MKSLVGYYRLPESLAKAAVESVEGSEKGFFRFGASGVCFGGSAVPGSVRKEPCAELYDILPHCFYKDGVYHVAFDVNGVANNLRLEKYLDTSIAWERQGNLKTLARTAYYLVRPLLTVKYRKHLQRFALRGWQDKVFPHWPVDVSVENIFEAILRLALSSGEVNKIPFIWFWPNGHSSCVIMTHDVETVAGRECCGTIMDIEAQFEIKSSFEVVPEVRYEVPEEFLESIRLRGNEICVHGLNHDGHLFDSREVFLERIGRINEYGKQFGAIGFRSPVMYRNVDWYDQLAFKYDMSIPNVGHLDPQKGGCCTVMPYFIGDVLELPLTTVQDYTLYHILQKDTLELWKEQTTTILRKNGLMSFIIHPDYTLAEKEQRLYASLLEYLSVLRVKENAWIALPREVQEWWRLRDSMRISEKGGRAEILGEGRERARIAYAKLDGNRIVYEIG